MAYSTGGWYQYPAGTTVPVDQRILPYSQTAAPPQQPQQIQNGGFVIAPSEEYVRNYPVAPGTTVTFKLETQPYLYTKTVGYSLLDPPTIEKFKLIKEGDTVEPETPSTTIDDLATAVSEMRKEIGALRAEINRKNYPDKRKGEKND